MSQLGQTRRFGRVPVTSGLPRSTDIVSPPPHVSKVPIPAVTQNGAVGLPRIAFLDTLRLIVRSLLPSSENKMDHAQEALRHDCPRSSSSAYARRVE